MTKYAKCATCGYTIEIGDDMDAGDFICPTDGTTLVAATVGDHIIKTATSMGADDLYTSDYGLSWEDLGVILSHFVVSAEYVGNGIVLVGDFNGHLYRSADYGMTWSDLGTIGNNGVMTLLNLGSGVVILGDDLHHIQRSVDYGLSWTDLGVISTHAIIASAYAGNNIAFVGDEQAHVWKTTDLGLTWSDKGLIGEENWHRIQNMEYCGDGILIVCTTQGQYRKSTDYGETWGDLTQLGYAGMQLDSIAYCGNGIVIVGQEELGYIYRSTDYGDSFVNIQSIGKDVYALAYLGNGVLIAGEKNGHIYRSTDYGKIWTDIKTLSSGALSRFVNLGNGIVIGGTTDHHIYRSTSVFGTANFNPNQFDKLFQFGCLGAITPDGTSYLAPGNGATQTNEIKIRVTRPGTLKNLFVKHRVASGAGGRTDIYTVRVNGADKTITCTLDNATTGSDTTHEVLVAQGDEISIKLVSNNAADTSADVVASLELV